MAEETEKPTGPNLKHGVAQNALTEGVPLLGHVDGQAVLLVRSHDEIYAVSAHCTHYGANLAGGLVVHDQIRCPWHHACFGLRDGAPAHGPAHTPLSTYEVHRQGDQVRVGAKLPFTANAAAATHPKQVTIIGSGAAGYAAAETLRLRGYRGPVTMITADSSPPYDRPNLSKDYLAGTAPDEWMALRPPEYYMQHGIELRLGARVQSIDIQSRTLTFASTHSLRFETLLLATGSDAVRLSIPGASLPHVYTLRTWEQCRNIIKQADKSRKIVVLGANFIGMETASALRARKLDVRVIAPMHMPMQTSLGAELGLYLQRLHESQGVVFHLGQEATRIEPERVVLQDGTAVPADMVILGVGAKPALDLARNAGIRVEEGIMVNAYLETSAPNIFAAGDNCAWPDPRAKRTLRVEHWVPAQRQGEVAARNILGEKVVFDAIPFFWTSQFGKKIGWIGYTRDWDRVTTHGSIQAGKALVAYWFQGRIGGVAAIGLDHVLLECELAMERGADDTLNKLLQSVT